MKVLIDAGHGIDTPGKRSPDGSFLEYLWNRQIADLVIARLVSRGVDASLVVTETNDISLRTRAMRVNRICDQVGAQNVLLVSIHSNAAGNGSAWMNAKGWSCYTTPGKTGSDEFAECFYDAFTRAFPDRRMRETSQMVTPTMRRISTSLPRPNAGQSSWKTFSMTTGRNVHGCS